MNGIMKKVAILSLVLAIAITLYLIITAVKHHSNTPLETIPEFKDVEFAHLKLTISYNAEFTIDDKNSKLGMLSEEENKNYAYIEIIGPVDDDFFEQEKLYENVKNNGYDVRNPGSIEIADYKVITMEYYLEDGKGLLAYLKPADNNLYELTIYKDDDTFDYEYLKKVVEIIKNAQ